MSEEKETSNRKETFMKPDRRQEEPKISFNDWFVITMRSNKKIQAHHYDSILAFAKKKNLTEAEPASKYDAALKLFGY
jgi:hypothetical protein